MEECAILDLWLHLQQHYASGEAGPAEHEEDTEHAEHAEIAEYLQED
jgi:hypothetical protein